MGTFMGSVTADDFKLDKAAGERARLKFAKHQSQKQEIMAVCEQRKAEVGDFKKQIGNLSQFDFVFQVHEELD